MTIATCMWCSREGAYRELQDKAFFEESVLTLGTCARHEAQLLPAGRPYSFPDVELLIVVHPSDYSLYDYLQGRFANVRGVRVMMERRERDRRQEEQVATDERRRLQRRVRRGQVYSMGYRFVRFR